MDDQLHSRRDAALSRLLARSLWVIPIVLLYMWWVVVWASKFNLFGSLGWPKAIAYAALLPVIITAIVLAVSSVRAKLGRR